MKLPSMTPEQFQQALSQEPLCFDILVKGARVHYRRWPKANAPGVLLVHGHAAHARWWDHIAPALTQSFDVSAIDLSGAGDSQHRTAYSARLFSEEMIAVTTHAGYQSPVVIGHSFGGTLARTACFLNPNWTQHLILLDAVIPSAKPIKQPITEPAVAVTNPSRPANRPPRIYATRLAAMKRFRLRPRQPLTHPHILKHIAQHSFRESEKGFEFKFDRAVFKKMRSTPDLPTGSETMMAIQSKTSLVIGRNSVFFDPATPMGEKNLLTAARHLPNQQMTFIEDAGHHLLVDQPLPVIEAILSLTDG